MSLDRLDDRNFLMYAAKRYNNPNFHDMQEFYDDLNRIKYIRRLFNRYNTRRDLQERLIVNHILIIYNVFDIEAASRILFYKLEGYESLLKSFLSFLKLMPDKILNIGPFGKNIISSDIETIKEIREKLEKM